MVRQHRTPSRRRWRRNASVRLGAAFDVHAGVRRGRRVPLPPMLAALNSTPNARDSCARFRARPAAGPRRDEQDRWDHRYDWATGKATVVDDVGLHPDYSSKRYPASFPSMRAHHLRGLGGGCAQRRPPPVPRRNGRAARDVRPPPRRSAEDDRVATLEYCVAAPRPTLGDNLPAGR